MIIVPITSTIRNYPFALKIEEKKIRGVILTDQLRSVTFENRRIKIAGKLKEFVIQEILEKVRLLFSNS